MPRPSGGAIFPNNIHSSYKMIISTTYLRFLLPCLFLMAIPKIICAQEMEPSEDYDKEAFVKEDWRWNSMLGYFPFTPNRDPKIFNSMYTALMRPEDVQILNINDLSLDTLPDEFTQLIHLRELRLRMDFEKLDETIAILSQLPQLRVLTLSGKLNELPSNIGALNQLQALNLSRLQLKTLPKEIGQMKHLRYIRLYNNRTFRSFPSEIGGLIHLEHLDFAGTRVKELPASIGKCKNIRIITANACGLQTIPDEFCKLEKLENINFGYNDISRLPDNFGDLTALVSVSLGGNRLTEIPESFNQLENLFYLDIARNKLKEVPNSIFNCNRMTQLWIHKNNIKSLPKELAEMDALNRILLDEEKINKDDIAYLKEIKPDIFIIDEN